MRRTSWAAVARTAIVWLFGAVILPLALLGLLVAAKRVPFSAAIEDGELFALGTSVAGAAIAVELILRPGHLVLGLTQLGLLLNLVANVAFFMATATISESPSGVREIATSLDAQHRAWSLGLFTSAAILSVVAVVRQATHQEQL